MKFRKALVFPVAALILAGCNSENQISDVGQGTTISTNTNPAIPPLTAGNSTIDCSGWAQGARTYVRQQGLLVINKVRYGVATFACGLPNSEFGSEFVESFVFENGYWAANGLVAGPEIQFFSTGSCISEKVIRCPAEQILENGMDNKSGEIIIYEEEGGLAWRFDLNSAK